MNYDDLAFDEMSSNFGMKNSGFLSSIKKSKMCRCFNRSKSYEMDQLSYDESDYLEPTNENEYADYL